MAALRKVLDMHAITEALHHWTSRATAADWQWYNVASMRVALEIATPYNLSQVQAAYIVAALSPRTPWSQNLDRAKRLIEGNGLVSVHTGVFQTAALSILHGQDPIDVVKNWPKVREFAPLLVTGNNPHNVAIDGIMGQLLGLTVTRANYPHIKQEVLQYAAHLHTCGSAVQSAAWEAYRRHRFETFRHF